MATAEISIPALGGPSASASEYGTETHRRLRAQDKVPSVENRLRES